jgi:hypothetical protein
MAGRLATSQMIGVPLNRRRLLIQSLVLSLSAGSLSRLPATAHDATPAAGNRYISDQFGYQITWPETWTLVRSDSEPGGYDMVLLTQGDATAYIVLSRPGDTPLSEIAGFMIDGPDTGDLAFVPGTTANDADGNPIEGETVDRVWIAQLGNLADEDVDGFTEFRYGEVRRLEDDLGVGLSLAMPATDFDGDIASYSTLLDGVTKLGALATPSSATPGAESV